MPQQSNKKIATNTIVLYIRMLFLMAISLYTSRVVLHILGATDYGIQNVVGGFITILSFLGTTVSSAISRFFAYEIGRGDKDKLNKYFILSFLVFGIFALFVLAFAETVGLWFVQNKMTIPEDRMTAAVWVYHMSIVSFLVQMFMIPFTSMIIAQERMTIYAYISIIEGTLKLLVVYLLSFIAFDKLIVYTILVACSFACSQSLYAIYCVKKYKDECKLTWYWNKQMFHELTSFSGWILFGTISGICRGQGLNIIINLFFSPAVNAARGIAYQVEHAVMQFVNGFYTSCRPQITKLYAQKNYESLMKLVFQSSRLCFFLILVLALPILFQVSLVLSFWLGEYPDYTEIFLKLVLVISIIDSLSLPFQGAITATGKIKSYQIVTGGLMIMTLPIAYLLLWMGYPPQSTMIVSMILSVVAQIIRIIYMHKLLNMDVLHYLKDVLLRIASVTCFSVACVYLLNSVLHIESFFEFVVYYVISVASVCIMIVAFGISSAERRTIMLMINKIIFK